MERDHAIAPPDVRKLLASSRFLREIDAANYMMSNRQKVCLAMLIEGELWRAHYKQMFRYEHGAWVTQTELKVEGWNILIALEGLFLEIAKLLEEREEQIPGRGRQPVATFSMLSAISYEAASRFWRLSRLLLKLKQVATTFAPRPATRCGRPIGREGWQTCLPAFDST